MKRLALLVLICLLVPLSAQAGEVKIYWGNWGSDLQALTVTYDGGITKSTGAGDALLTPTGVAGLPDKAFYTFCVDLQHWTQTPVNATLASMADWNAVQERGANAALDYQLKAASYLGLQYFASPRPDAQTRAAYQIAVWELLYETINRTSDFSDWTLAGGSVYFGGGISTSILTEAQDLIHAIPDDLSATPYAGLVNTTDSASGAYAQNFMAPVPDGGLTAMLMGMALCGLAALRRRLS